MDAAYYESALTSTSDVPNGPYSFAVYSWVLAAVLNEVERVAAPSGAALAYPPGPRDAAGGCEARIDCEGGFGLRVIVAGKAVAAPVTPLLRSTTLRVISSRSEKNSEKVRCSGQEGRCRLGKSRLCGVQQTQWVQSRNTRRMPG